MVARRPDGQTLSYVSSTPETASDIWLLPLSGDKKPRPLLHTRVNERDAQISPDGRWLAYATNETGRPEIYVQPYPSGSGRWQISTGGGLLPRWRRDGRELFYGSRSKMTAVLVDGTGPSFLHDLPKELFEWIDQTGTHSTPFFPYAVSADGQQFLTARARATEIQSSPYPIAIVLNWRMN